MTEPKILRLADYRPPSFTTDLVDLNFDIHPDHTIATSKVTYKRTAEGSGKNELVLDAENPNPKDSPDYVSALIVDGVPLAEGTGYTYDRANNEIRIPVDPSTQTLDVEIRTHLEPKGNAALSGLYQSDGVVVTQCESQGFRRITPFTDRPDVMALYKARVEAPANICPVLLANGNMTGSGKLPEGRHWASFEDPFRKPCYLFCTANGKLDPCTDIFTTMSGKKVDLVTYLETGENPELARHAVNALKASMKFDEEVFDCEYDLDNFKTVAVAKFTFGAMENKGLNVFRDVLIKASPRTATDANYQRIIDVVGHEYFHNFSGNRVTLANWFNISLKEGLTVLREQMFTASTTSKAIERISAVQMLRTAQFPEDDGPLAHAVLPKEVMSINNCYSMTIYEKGCEVIRMMGELMGEEKLIQGIKNYFRKYDGQAVTIDEFRDCMEEVSGLDLNGQFRLWYDQAGRPKVTASGVYDQATQTYTLTLQQKTAPTTGQPEKKPMLIPLRVGLVDAQGKDMKLVLEGEEAASAPTERVLQFTEEKQTFVFKNVTSEPAFHSLLRGYSAIVDIDPGLSEDQLYKQLLTDPDGFNRWDAGQKLAMAEMKRLYAAQEKTGAMPEVSQRYLDSLQQMTRDQQTDPALLARTMMLPDIKELEATLRPVNPVAIIAMRRHLQQTIGRTLHHDLLRLFERLHDGKPYSFDYASVGKRDLKRIAVDYLLANGKPNGTALAKNLYFGADNMTDKMMALNGLNRHETAAREKVMKDFYKTFKGDSLTIQKWFMAQSTFQEDGTIARLRKISSLKSSTEITPLFNRVSQALATLWRKLLHKKPVFNWENPGHVGSLIQGFGENYAQFHRADGKGYEFMADAVIHENGINPSTAARLVSSLCRWQNYTPPQAKLMIAQLERINATPGLGADVKEKVLKSLPAAAKRAALGLAP